MHDDRDRPVNEPVDDGSDDLLVRRVARELRQPVRLRDDFDADVMAAVRAAPAPAPLVRQGAWAWITRPRTLRVSPLAGLAIAAGLAAVMVLASREAHAPQVTAVAAVVPDTGSAGARLVAARAGTQPQQVQFVLVAPHATSVALVGDFNDWNAAATPLTPVRAGGVWTITVPLPPGRYTYNFVVDGTKVLADPAAPPAPADDFGTPASVVTVAGAQT